MERKLISSASPYEKTIGFSRAVRIGNMIAVSGTGPIAPDGSTAGGDSAYKQAIRCLEIIKKAIEDAGGKIEDVIRTRMYITCAEVQDEVGRAHGEIFADIRPVATMVVVKELVRPEWLVEIEAEAVVD